MKLRLPAIGFAVAFFCSSIILAADHPQWGQRFTRNMVSSEVGLPDRFDPATGENVKWSAALGTQCYATPVVAGGKVLIGTNNGEPRDARHQGDRGVLMCFDESDGTLVWQLVVPKLSEDIYLDWPEAGICSPATVEGDRVYTVTNRDEVVCLDLHGMSNGNDGPFQAEGRHASPPEDPAAEVGPLDADILWLLDLRTAAGVHPHDSSHSGILLDGRYLYLNTNNGVNSKHDAVAAPEAPALVVVDKTTGRLIAQEGEHISRRLVHGTWSAPVLAETKGRRQIIFGGPDGTVYGFEALTPTSSEPAAATADSNAVPSLRCLWRFDCDPTAPKENIQKYMGNRKESASNIKSTPVLDHDRIYVTVGGDIWWGKREAWLKCIDVAKAMAQGGDVTETAQLWSQPLQRHCVSTPSVDDGLVYVADCAGRVRCLDAATGREYWVHDARGEIWASTLVADGKVFIGTRKGDFWVLAAGKERRILSSVRLESGVIGTAVAANGTLLVSTMTRLFAVSNRPTH